MENLSNFISLEASAGSGKTHNLTKRYITLLLNFDSDKQETVKIQNILALTFANKATIEMKDRIIESLKKISLGIDVKDLTSSINLPKNKIKQNALLAINSLILNYDNFNVRTIDSFINLIIKSCALKLGFSPNYKILDSYNDYIDYSVDSFLDKILTDKNIEKILNDFFEQFLADDGGSWSFKQYISTKFKEFYKKEISKESIQINVSRDYADTLSILSEKFYKVCCLMPKIKEYEGIDKRFKNVIDKIQTKQTTLFNFSSKYFCREEIPYNAKVNKSKQLDELFERAKKLLKEFVEFRAKHFYDNYIKIFKYVIDEFDLRTQKDSVLFLQDINRKVLDIFDKDTLVPEIYFRLSASFKDFLIDEFQDTNKIQWETLKLIVEENLSQNGSFFYVGDKKQAIYGFRGSDFQIFDLPLNEFQIYNPKKLTLNTNYRSTQAIVDFNNSIFSSDNIKNLLNYIVKTQNINNAEKYCSQIANVFENSFQNVAEDKKDLGYVEISYLQHGKQEENLDDKVKEYLYKTINDLVSEKRFDYKDITVLCRSGKEVEQIGKWLLDKNINIESFKTLNIINSNIVKELFSALQFFNSPIDDIAFTSFITSSIFLEQTNLTKQEILNFITDNSFNKNSNKVLYIEFRNKYPQTWEEYIEEFFNSVGFIAVYEFMVSIIAKFKVVERFAQYSNVIMTFLEVINDFEKKEQGLQNFIDYFKDYETNKSNEKFFIKVPSNNAIKIMTIHKAKGLQFNVVIMPYFYIENSALKNPFLVEENNKYSFVYVKKDFMLYSDKINDIYYKTYFKRLSDELNILYVATTRAVYEFYALIMQPENEDDNKKEFINVLIKEDVRVIGKKQKYADLCKSKKDTSIIELSSNKIEDIIEVISDSSTEIYGRKNKDMLLQGQIIHYGLSLIETFDMLNVNTVLDDVIKQVSVCYPNEDIAWLHKVLENLLSNAQIYYFFDKNNKVFNEKEFVDKFGNTIRIDKLVIRKDSVDIVDFKSSIYDKMYIKEQMKHYCSVVKEIYQNKKINCFVIDIENSEVISIRHEDALLFDK